ncbi:putative gustatory receptor 59b [Drosophila pseudoobscura]|uniref:Gustatory receptor n=1 Tax=Drosophila pseudoobscura pseudoobscura TaxID=46245 RepID=A0A6I8VVW6_DROPS|nr:putative gustatory receptor 59b [Drosophila pseudoobscura]
MGRFLLLDIFQWFAVIIGLTSYRVVDDRFVQTRLSRMYTLIVNVITVTMLPAATLDLFNSFSMGFWLPQFMWITPYVLHAVNYAVIVHTLIFRGHRNIIQMELHHLSVKLNREMGRAGKQMNSTLRRLFYLKTLTLSCMCLWHFLQSFIFIGVSSLSKILGLIIINSGFMILMSIVHCYFVSLWKVAIGYDFVNQQLEELIATRSPLISRYAEELRSLWSLHASLSLTAHKINRIYGRQMLASRFEYITFTAVDSYMEIIYYFSESAPAISKCFGISFFSIRTIDFFMADYICDLVAQYQSMPKHTASEGVMSNELSSFVIYQNSMNLNLKICGLFPANRKQWLNMMACILGNSAVLMQYHLMMSGKEEKYFKS